MAIYGTESSNLEATRPMLASDDSSPASGWRASSCRCPGCGTEIAYDSLAALCRCSDECYGDGWPNVNAGAQAAGAPSPSVVA